MKKVLILLVMIFTLSLVGCGEVTTDYDYTPDIQDLQNQINDNELHIAELQKRLDSLVVIEGLNGRTSIYENETLYETADKEGDYLDKSKLPEYIFDVNGDFIDENMLLALLVEKYFPLYVKNDDTYILLDYRFSMRIFEDSQTTPYSVDDIIARIILLINEFRNYDYYYINCSQVEVINFINGNRVEILFASQNLLTDTIPIIPEIVCNNYLFNEISGASFSTNTVKTYYDGYVMNNTFDGYVLDYKL